MYILVVYMPLLHVFVACLSMLAGPLVLQVLVVALVGGRALLWPPEIPRVQHNFIVFMIMQYTAFLVHGHGFNIL